MPHDDEFHDVENDEEGRDVEETDQSDELDTEVEPEEHIPTSVPAVSPSFMDDPWPRLTLILTVVGFLFILAPPPQLWAAQKYSLLGVYALMILMGVGIMFSLEVWHKMSQSRLRWGGLTNIVVIVAAGGAGIVDAFLWMLLGVPLIPGLTTPILSLSAVIVVFCLYSLWLLRRTVSNQ
jgi:hypothetical protein